MKKATMQEIFTALGRTGDPKADKLLSGYAKMSEAEKAEFRKNQPGFFERIFDLVPADFGVNPA